MVFHTSVFRGSELFGAKDATTINPTTINEYAPSKTSSARIASLRFISKGIMPPFRTLSAPKPAMAVRKNIPEHNKVMKHPKIQNTDILMFLAFLAEK